MRVHSLATCKVKLEVQIWYLPPTGMNLVMAIVCSAFLLGLLSLASAREEGVGPSREEEEGVEFPLEWHLWKGEHRKMYHDNKEELRRHVVWLGNQEYINQHNKYAHLFGYTLKMNRLGDLVCGHMTRQLARVEPVLSDH